MKTIKIGDTVQCWLPGWEEKGLKIIGKVKNVYYDKFYNIIFVMLDGMSNRYPCFELIYEKSKTVISEKLQNEFKKCIDKIIESRYEDDKINCNVMNLMGMVIREMALKQNEYKNIIEKITELTGEKK